MNNPFNYYSWSPKQKKVWNQCMSVFRENAAITALLLIYVFFYRFWESLIGDCLMEKFLKYCESNVLNDIIFGFAVIACGTMVVVYWGRNLKRQTLLISIIVVLLWIYYRIICGHFDLQCGLKDTPYLVHFTSLSLFPFFKYFDIVLVYALCVLVLCVRSLFHFKELIFDNGFTRDAPISNTSEDKLQRKKYAEDTANKLMNTNTCDGSFTLGINAPWGDGKTSFMNMMKETIVKNYSKDSIVIDFNPWTFSTETDLISAFFDELSKSLKIYDSSLAKNIIDYSKLLAAFNTTETNIISSLIDLNHQDITILEKKQHIIKAINHSKRRIIVFIDDLDRLDSNELLEMLKLIRNISDFPYMYFVVAYDRSYLARCLEQKMSTKGVEFIKKIFQHEQSLPIFPNRKIYELLNKNIITSSYTYNEREELTKLLQQVFPTSISLVSNYREIKRIQNNFFSDYVIKNAFEVDNLSLRVVLSIFKVKYPLVFEAFEQKWNKIHTFVADSDGPKGIKLSDNGLEGSKSFFYDYISEHKKELNIDDNDIEVIEEILSIIFKENGIIHYHPDFETGRYRPQK